MKHLKLRQVVDVVFDVHDDHSVEIGRRIRAVESELSAARAAYRAAEQIVDEQHVGDREDLEGLHRTAKDELAACAQALAALDAQARADTMFAEELRERHRGAADQARRAAADLRDRETQLQRMLTLHGSYADDVAKWTMLAEADHLFEPMRVSACPSCLAPLAGGEERCPACLLPITDGGSVDVTSELRSAKTRLAELNRYVEELQEQLPGYGTRRNAHSSARPAPPRRSTRRRRTRSPRSSRSATPLRGGGRRPRRPCSGRSAGCGWCRAWSGARPASCTRWTRSPPTERNSPPRARRRGARTAPPSCAGSASGTARSCRSGATPKLADAYLAEDLTPYMRGEPYTAASSGGRTLIALAWQLALFEVAWESRSSHPGFLMLDSPQKNLGVAGDLADSLTIERIYRHLEQWLAGRGVGAQIVVADNAPPPAAADDVVVRFSAGRAAAVRPHRRRDHLRSRQFAAQRLEVLPQRPEAVGAERGGDALLDLGDQRLRDADHLTTLGEVGRTSFAAVVRVGNTVTSVGLQVRDELRHRLLGHLRPLRQQADGRPGIVKVLKDRAVRRPHRTVPALGEPFDRQVVEQHEQLTHQHREVVRPRPPTGDRHSG